MGTGILTEIRAAGIALSVDGGNLVASPKAAITDDVRSLIRAHKPAILAALAHPHLPGVPPELAARLSAEDLEDIAAGDIPLGTVQAFEQAAVPAETADLREHFEERAGILEYDAGLPRPEAELEAARITAALARNRGYRWASLRSALADYPALLSQVPDRPGAVDALALGVATVAVLSDKRVVRQGTFTGAHEVKA